MKHLLLCIPFLLMTTMSRSTYNFEKKFTQEKKDFVEWQEKITNTDITEYPHTIEFKRFIDTNKKEWHLLKYLQENGRTKYAIDHKIDDGSMDSLLEDGRSIPPMQEEVDRLMMLCSAFLHLKKNGYNLSSKL